MKQIIIPSSVTLIDSYAFERCTSLENVLCETPSSSKIIQNNNSTNCESLEQITIPSSVTLIDSYAFEECTSLSGADISNHILRTNRHNYNCCNIF